MKRFGVGSATDLAPASGPPDGHLARCSGVRSRAGGIKRKEALKLCMKMRNKKTQRMKPLGENLAQFKIPK